MYALVALGYNITYATSRTVNFSQGQSVMVGAVVAYALHVGAGWPLLPAVVVSLAALAALGVIVERVAVRPFLASASIAWLLSTIAIGIIAENVAMVVFGKQSPVGERVIAALKTKYGLKGPEDILAPVGTANAYDAMQLVALAIDKAGAADGAKIRDALENLGEYRGLIKTYKRPFTTDEHDALTENDYILVTWRGGKIVPVAQK